MKCSVRLKIVAGITLTIGLVIILLVIEDKCETYDPIGYIQASIPWLQTEDDQPLPLGGRIGDRDKIIVVPSREEEDASWVTDELSE